MAGCSVQRLALVCGVHPGTASQQNTVHAGTIGVKSTAVFAVPIVHIGRVAKRSLWERVCWGRVRRRCLRF